MAVAYPAPTSVIELGRSEPIRLGPLRIEPASRQVVCGARRERLEPRVMQVLVALARAPGEVVSRDELIAACWGGVVVGDNAIHRTISRLRDLAAAFGDDTFRIETIAKVGYRLVLAARSGSSPADAPALAPAPSRWRPGRAGQISASGVAMLAALGAVWTAAQPRPVPSPAVIVIEGDRGEAAAQLSRDLEVELPKALGGPSQSAFVVGSDAAAADYRVRIATQASGGAIHAEARISPSKPGDLLWSESFDVPADQTADLRRVVAARLATAFDCASDIGRDRQAIDAAARRMFVTACERLQRGPDPSALSLLRNVIARYPNSATALAMQSLDEANLSRELDYSSGVTPDREALARAAAVHLARARELGARAGVLTLAEGIAMPRFLPGQQLALVERGIAADPDYAPLHAQRTMLLQRIGRLSDAIEAGKRAVALAPLSIDSRYALIWALAYGGRLDAARAELADIERVWPNARALQEMRDALDLRFGDPDACLRRIDRGAWTQAGSNELLSGSVRSYLLARADPTPENVERAMQDVSALARGSPGAPWALQAYAAFSRVDAAYAMLDQPGALRRASYWPEVLFRPYTRALRHDPRFMRLTARLGLVSYWRETGRWPDFCEDRALPYDCRVEAAKAEAALAKGA